MAEAKISFSTTRGQHFFTIQLNLLLMKNQKSPQQRKVKALAYYTHSSDFIFKRSLHFFLMETQNFIGNAVLNFTLPVSSTILLYSQYNGLEFLSDQSMF